MLKITTALTNTTADTENQFLSSLWDLLENNRSSLRSSEYLSPLQTADNNLVICLCYVKAVAIKEMWMNCFAGHVTVAKSHMT